ncbi:ST1C2-like protein [Mya arenaria]|uniref:ST1C2-like protein n=1 Tax=Mya arenaria TaxID=6604 RepID=A0ABY7FR56_MYAAR|nr:ST1C2-like protein [Mya arenaria]
MSKAPQKYTVEDGAGNSFELVDVDGTPFPAYFTDDPTSRLQEIRDMTARDDDIFIVAYPKAGTHWVWEMTTMLLRGTAEYHASMKEAQMIELTGASAAANIPSPRVFNTHLLFRQLPTDAFKRRCKMVYVTRNPKDMAVSRYCHNTRGQVAYKGTFHDYLPLYMQGKVAEVKRLATFLGTKTDGEFLEAVCDRCSFTNLKTSYEKTKADFGPGETPLNYTFRKGQIGDWKNWFTVAESEAFDGVVHENLGQLGLDFVYTRFADGYKRFNGFSGPFTAVGLLQSHGNVVCIHLNLQCEGGAFRFPSPSGFKQPLMNKTGESLPTSPSCDLDQAYQQGGTGDNTDPSIPQTRLRERVHTIGALGIQTSTDLGESSGVWQVSAAIYVHVKAVAKQERVLGRCLSLHRQPRELFY